MSARPIGASPVNNILLAVKNVRTDAEHAFTATSLPGHLLHFVLCGRVQQQCNGREYILEPGQVLWYHEDEWVEGRALEVPWEFYSINFIAPALAPPPEASRLIAPATKDVAEHFAAIVQAWNDPSLTEQQRMFRAHGRLSLLLELVTQCSGRAASDASSAIESDLWWEIETRVRRDLRRPLDLRQLEEWSGFSAATIARAAQAAVGEPPMRRIKGIRLTFARGLVLRSQLNFSEIATRIGYSRLHEFSRDYKRRFGKTPSEERRQGNEPRA